MNFILITGASTGIGENMARQLAAKQYNLILVARNQHKLQQLKNELEEKYSITIEMMAVDLAKVENAVALHQKVKHHGFKVEMLINNAGVGSYGDFTETSLAQDLDMIKLNISSLVALTKLFAQDMKANRSGKIMNVASLLSFLPFPYYSVYSATKAFVLAFTETIAAELEGTGVVVTALCPGPTDTPFNSDKMLTTNAYSANRPMSSVAVAKVGVQLLLNGKGKKIVGFNNWFISNLPRITPDFIMMKIKKHLASQKNN